MGSSAYHVWNVVFLLRHSPNPSAVPSECGVNYCHPAPCTQTFLLHIFGNAGYAPSKDCVAVETCGFPFPVGQPVPACFGCSSSGCGCADRLRDPLVAFPTLPSSPLLSSQQQEQLNPKALQPP